jgi:hypothetical protein
MQNKILFYQAASALSAGLSLADYEYRFYADNAGKEILTVDIDTPLNGQVLNTTVRLVSGRMLVTLLQDLLHGVL